MANFASRIHSSPLFVQFGRRHSHLHSRPVHTALSPYRHRLKISIISPTVLSDEVERSAEHLPTAKVDVETEVPHLEDLRRLPAVALKLFGMDLRPSDLPIRKATPVKKRPQRLSFSSRRTKTPPPSKPSLSLCKEADTPPKAMHFCPSIVRDSPRLRCGYVRYSTPRSKDRSKSPRRVDPAPPPSDFLVVTACKAARVCC